MSTSIRRVLPTVIALCLLAACGGGQQAAPSGSDAGGGTPAASDEVLELNMLLPLYEPSRDMDNAYWKEYQKKTNTKLDIEWVPAADLNSKTDLKLASGDLPEILVGEMGQNRTTMVNAARRGMFWDLAPLLGDLSGYPNIRDNFTPGIMGYGRLDSKQYAIPRNRPQINRSIKIRKDWLDQLDLEVPTTLDEYRTVLKAMVDNDASGTGNTLGLTGYQFMNFFETTIAVAFGTFDLHYDEDGGLVPSFISTQHADFIEYFRGLYEDGSLPKEFMTMNGTQNTELWLSGRSASIINNYWHDWPDMEQIKNQQPEVEIISLPPMKGPAGYTSELDKGIAFMFFVSAKVEEEKVERFLGYIDMTSTDEYLDIAYYGFEGIHYNVVDGEKVMTGLGVAEVGMSEQQPNALRSNTWAKVVYPAAPKAFNDALLEQSLVELEYGKVDIFSVLLSDTWATEWPKYDKDWNAMMIKAIVGQVTMEEYRGYLEELRNDPALKKSFIEFAESYEDMFGTNS